MASNEETNAAGTDTRPPMLVESDYDSWKIRIHRYIRGKPNGKQIWKSIQNGPTPHPMITDPPPTDSAAVPAPREKLDSEFSEEENKLEMADTQAEIILSQGFLGQIFTTSIKQALKGDLGLMWRCYAWISFHPTTIDPDFSNSGTHATVHDGHIVTEQFRGRLQIQEMTTRKNILTPMLRLKIDDNSHPESSSSLLDTEAPKCSKLRAVRPEERFYGQAKCPLFVLSKDLSGDQAYWLSAKNC
ncbi:hypothetical protein Tco_0528456 [Tanacetum coccineum]